MIRSVFALISLVLIPVTGWSNGGPFFIAYPDGDNSAKGVLAVLGERMLPGTEEGLQVLEEDLTIRYEPGLRGGFGTTTYHLPYTVSAAYKIENTTDKYMTVYFGFPILGGNLVQYQGMAGPRPSFSVQSSGKVTEQRLLYPIQINGMLRESAHAAVENWIGAEASRREQVERVREAQEPEKKEAKAALETYLRETEGFSPSDAALFAELISLDIPKDSVQEITVTDPQGKPEAIRISAASLYGFWGGSADNLEGRYLGSLAAIGQQKATQLWTHLASAVDPGRDYSYAAFYKAWGGETRDLALDGDEATVRPRIVDLSQVPRTSGSAGDVVSVASPFSVDALYGRVDYLADANLSDASRESLQRILENLPVIFSYTPMSLGVYKVEFPASTTSTVTVTYQQESFVDTKDNRTTYQLCYVIKTALNWEEFGKINLRVEMPEGRQFVSDPPVERVGTNGSAIVCESTLTSYDRNLRIAVREAGEPKVETGKAMQQEGRRGG